MLEVAGKQGGVMGKIDEILNACEINEKKIYTPREVAAICGTTPETVRRWRQFGLKGPAGGVVVLEAYCIGGYPRVLGAHLKEFLAERAKYNKST